MLNHVIIYATNDLDMSTYKQISNHWICKQYILSAFTFDLLHTRTRVRQNVCSWGSYRLVSLLVIGRCTQTRLRMRAPLWVNHRNQKSKWYHGRYVRLTDQVRYHQHSSRVFVGARLDGLLAPPASKLKNWAIRKSLGNRGWPHTPHTHSSFTVPLPLGGSIAANGMDYGWVKRGRRPCLGTSWTAQWCLVCWRGFSH